MMLPLSLWGNNQDVGSIEVVTSADAHVRDKGTDANSNNDNLNFGSEKILLVKDDATGFNRQIYLKFDLTGVNFTGKNNVQLKLNVQGANTDIAKTQWIVSSTSSDWNETQITWNTKPAVGVEVASSDGVAAGNSVLFDVSEHVLSEIGKGTKIISFHILGTRTSGGKHDASFSSKEADDNTKHPRLVISYKEKVDGDEEDSIFNLIMERIQAKEKNVNISSIDNQTKEYIETVKEDGSFPDFDYSNNAQTNWKPIGHLDRLKPIILSYTTKGSQYYENEDVYNKIVSMLTYWYNADPRSSNWYMQQIAAPQRMGILLILMRTGKKPLSTSLESLLTNRMRDIGGAPDQSGSQGTGANKVDIATHWVYRGCLTKNKVVLEKGIQQVFYPLFYTIGEGFQHDYSYLQHGQQLYIGGYGDVIAQGICNVAQYVRGTTYELGKEKFDILFNFMRNTYLHVIRGQYFLYNVAGRSLSRPNALSKSGFYSVLELLKSVDPDNTDEYNAAIKRVKGDEPASYGLEPYHAHYWRSDYTLHQRPGFTFDVRSVSTRTLRNENGNGENVKGYFLSEGATNIAVKGDEYYNIFPAWDWGRVPGTTTPALTSIPKPGEWGSSGTNTFVGGVSDGVYGVSTFSMRNYEYTSVNTEAKKSWFFFDNEVVCLGAGIRSTASAEVNTTMNQCLLEGNVTVIKTDNTSEVYTTGQKSSRTFDNNLSWVLHGEVGYYLPSGGNIVVNNQTQSGTWTSINTSQGGSSVSKDVFKLWFNHGVKPTDSSYAYVVVPNVNTTEKAAAYKKENVRILSNTELIQAVEHAELGIVGIVFYGSATFKYSNDISIRATRACTVMLRDLDKSEVKVYVADPSASLKDLSLIVDVPKIQGVKELGCKLPSEKAYAGSTQEFIINKDTPDYEEIIDPNDYIEVVADASVRGGSYASVNYGSSNMLEVKKEEDPSYAREAFMKFDVSGADFTQAKEIHLVLTALEGDTDYLNNTLHITACGSSWVENTLTWSNKPTATGSTIASGKAVEIGKPLCLDIKNYILENVKAGNTLLSFHLTNTYTGVVAKTRITFHSKESVYEDMRPRIRITPKDDVSVPEVSVDDNRLLVYPNPVTKGETIAVKTNDNADYVISINDLFGKTLLKTTENAISTQGLSTGMYIISVVKAGEDQVVNMKLLVK